MLALMLDNAEFTNKLVLTAAKRRLILFWLLFEPRAVRISPPLTITTEEIRKACQLILEILDEIKAAC